MAEDTEKTDDNKSEVEILATALADSSKNASASNTTTVRVLGTLLAFSVLGNIALAGLNIKGNFFGTDIEMGGADALGPDGLEDLGYMEPEFYEDPFIEGPPMEWCAEMKGYDDVPPEDIAICKELYPVLFEQ
ncbi:hypothetical protein N9917_00420 [Deltaproteobacteria bacterium]|nr:hypothetical protein [Deltaproteobacteria bacterium]